ncbi:MAG: hypothetical protein FWC75_06370 [Oscillospiraceae bacterium]|nr:hypothetical protein [Oscillospiraceae bacterium]
MLHKENDRTDVGASEAVKESNLSGSTSLNSSANHTTFSESRQPDLIENVLINTGAYGAENKLMIPQLLELTSLPNARTLQQGIATERKAGALILSGSSGGYHLPSLDPESARQEMMEHERCLRARALNTLAVLKPVRRALRAVQGQIGPLSESEGGCNE